MKWFAVALIAICISLVSLLVAHRSYVAANEHKTRWYDRFCSATRDAIRQDRSAFEAGTQAEREFARDRFFSSAVIYHGSASIAMCLDERMPASPGCLLTSDWPCLAKFALTIEIELGR